MYALFHSDRTNSHTIMFLNSQCQTDSAILTLQLLQCSKDHRETLVNSF